MMNTVRLLAFVLAVLAGCGAPLAGAAETVPPPPPGPYWITGRLCGEDDCDNIPGRWRALAPATLYAASGSDVVVGHLPKGAWVQAVEKKTLMTPLRGEVRIAGDGLTVGDIVYGPFSDAEDENVQVWRNGQRLAIDPDADPPRIDWASPSPGVAMRVMWVRVERTLGRGGWLRDPDDFACMGEHPGDDEGC